MTDEGQDRMDDVLDGDLELSTDDAENVTGGTMVTGPGMPVPTKQASTAYSTTVKNDKGDFYNTPQPEQRTIDRSAGTQALNSLRNARGGTR
jgi:hypothetical protein